MNRFALVLMLLVCLGPIHYVLAHSFPEGNIPEVEDLKVEYFTNPIGIDAQNPRLSWCIKSKEKNTVQSAYRIQAAQSEEDFKEGKFIWDTDKVSSDQSVHVAYEGPDPESGQRYYWRVRIWDNHNNQSEWSDIALWEMGLLHPDDWQAEWIEPAWKIDSTKPQPCPMLRNEFNVEGNIQSARAYVTSHGLYEMMINGKRVGEQEFTPGWTSYHNRLQYQTYDVTDILQSGDNAIGVTLGDGWYRGYLAWGDKRNHYGKRLALLVQVEIKFEDGSTKMVGTDDSWKVATGPILKSDIYMGETYDARLEKTGWTNPGYDDADWTTVTSANHKKGKLVAPDGPPVRQIQEIKPLEVFTTPEGDTVVDMGQNMVGWIRLKVNGKRGTKVKLKHAEVLTKEGNFYTENLRAAQQTNTYILNGKGEETWEPAFTFQGFRYVKVENFPGELQADDLTGVVIHSDIKPTGHFETSNALINQLQHNIVWGQKGNFLDIPTDCPQRDERLGWTGDIQVFAQTACFNMHSAGFLTKWLQDLKADQLTNGSVPHVIPNVVGEDGSGAAGWADASVIVPWTVYQAYGDVAVLEQQYESMKAWVDYMRQRAGEDDTPYLWDIDFTFGDWLSYNSTSSDYPGAYTDKNLISTAYFARSADIVSRTAEILGKNEDTQNYADLFEKIKVAFQHEYMTPNGRIMSNTQTAYLLALQFDLLSDEMKQNAIRNLVKRVNKRSHLTTGFLGTPHLNPVLSQYGHMSTAYKLLLRKDYPSWLYPVTNGATTIWERWDGIKPDGSFQNAGMNSFNHYAYGAIGEWLYRTVAGIQPVEPGYKQITINPRPGGGLTYARGMIHTMYGKVESDWQIEEGQFKLTVEIPVNTRATIMIPGATLSEVTMEGDDLNQAEGIAASKQEGENVSIVVGSGRYTFISPSVESAAVDQNSEETAEDENKLTASSKIGALIANRDSRSVLNKYIPYLMASPWLSQVMGFSLNQANSVLPNQYKVDDKDLESIMNTLK